MFFILQYFTLKFYIFEPFKNYNKTTYITHGNRHYFSIRIWLFSHNIGA